MIQVRKLSYSIPEKELYKKVSFTIADDGHYAFIGSNGTGKSTLVSMMLQPDEYLYEGKIEFSEAYKNSRIGYVSQFSQEEKPEETTVFTFISEEFVALENKIAQLCDKMGTETDLDAVFEEYQAALDEKDAIDGDHYESNIKKQLKLAQLEKLENQKLSNLSGGEFKLIQVIKEMMLSPKMLIMDEPDVFLDFDHINALKDLINAHKGTLLIITHNRYLLNHCFDHILHLEDTDIQEFEGTYLDYNLELLSTKVELQEAVAKDEEEIERQQNIVNRIRANATAMDNASLGRSVHARQTLLDRLESRKTKAPFVYVNRPEISFQMEEEVQQDAEPILSLVDYEVSFDEQLLEHVNFQMKLGDKVAIVGKNGTGKTTLLREICDNQKSSIQISQHTRLAMFSQVTGELYPAGHTLTEIIMEKSEEKGAESSFHKKSEAVDFLGKYGFVEEDAGKRFEDLSGGEKDLFQLAVISLEGANLLLLDEPTGHLDVYAQMALEQAIENYKGSVLMVSHDYYSVANSMDYVLLVEDDHLRQMSIRRFRQMIYANHFDKEYLLLEEKKKELEMRVEQLLEKKEFGKAKLLLEQLGPIVKKLNVN
ncbi:MAG: ATP-binding cassette domain-containing protein [Lachnospiraceae bacterium]|nr:ATP-binding cassette domain-containing protein [Lachnospiraceae bacterium]